MHATCEVRRVRPDIRSERPRRAGRLLVMRNLRRGKDKPIDERLRTAAAGSISGCVAAVGAAGWLLPLAWAQRGYAAVGGEWLAIAAIGALVGVVAAWGFERHQCGR